MPILFFTNHKDTITGLSFIAGLIGLGFTIYQVGKTNSTLQATNGYAIQKDAREMIGTLRGEKAFSDYVLRFDPNKQYSDEIKNEANRSIALLLNFYLAVFRQYKAGGITDSLALSFGKDFCDDVINKSVPIKNFFIARASEKHDDFRELKNAWCP
ncbi:hypothetical protein G6321_00053655 [Bradyrhizobium barranii subsp. barranii]|uniref:DUF4760 domain-containing protein n=1 Tax=Bradyrhizobium barranii subsp. barranii TaxID=2823807 RepID=A0A7Z0TQ40_9BRAD|nr:hypothetical protein [Bradyrhizobium barranii]UGX94290.1 hypothetical protein G6321_00053655 [Bradyrhizobium barranii subsp. barranii]